MDDVARTGKHTYLSKNLVCKSWGEGKKVYFGAFCSVADCTIFLGGNHRTDRITTFPFGHTALTAFPKCTREGHPKSNGDVVVGNDVWIGYNATIMSGLTIGDGAVIAANAHVVSDVEPYAIVGGNPAKLIRYRFDPTTITQLLQIKWWDWEDAKINDNLHLLCDETKIEEFLRLHATATTHDHTS